MYTAYFLYFNLYVCCIFCIIQSICMPCVFIYILFYLYAVYCLYFILNVYCISFIFKSICMLCVFYNYLFSTFHLFVNLNNEKIVFIKYRSLIYQDGSLTFNALSTI